MTLPRSSLVSTESTRYYHCISRCVRRAFLCGVDSVTGQSFEHRRQWLVERLALLERLFAVDVCAYCAMSNHSHLVLRLNPDQAAEWSGDEVLERWCTLFSGPTLVQRYRERDTLSTGELRAVSELVERYRARLCDLSWFMRCLNEWIARKANAEDRCTGRFWQGRFTSQALLDEQAILSCMLYVELNPIRAAIADTPEAADYTSAQQRIREMKTGASANTQRAEPLSSAIPRLLRFTGSMDDNTGLPFALDDYLMLLDWSGRAIHPEKPGSIPDDIPPILKRLQVDAGELVRYLARQDYGFYQVIGRQSAIRRVVARLRRDFHKGISAANRLFPEPA